MELPELFLNRMKELLPREEYQSYLDSYSEERVYGLRVNTSKISPEEFKKISPFSLEPIPWIPNGFYYNGTEKPAKDPYYYAGLYYLQEPSAMTPALVLPIEPGDRVLDLCAAPGGKSTELAARLKGKGLLVSNDISNSRAKALLKNLELFGIPNAFITSEAPGRLAEHFPEYFDKILIDAPCSGEGMFRKEPSVIKSWLEHGNGYFADLQKDIVTNALKMLRPGGMLLYSTCTFSPMEDEQTISFLLKQDERLDLIQPQWYEGFDHGHPEWADGDERLSCCVRIWPHRMKGEGHFLALLKKSEEVSPRRFGEISGKFSAKKAGNENIRRGSFAKAPALPEEFTEFMKTTSFSYDPKEVQLRQEKVTIPPECDSLGQGLRILRSGLLLGEAKTGRFEPSQAFAMALKKEEFPNCLDLSREDPRVIRYLKGETIEADEPAKGWVLICVDGYPLGFGKIAGGSVKNKYLAGWRWM